VVTEPLREALLVQPIHRAGIDVLRGAGMVVRLATASDMATVATEIGDAQVVVTRNAGLNAAAIDAAPRLSLIVVHGIGYDPVDVHRATARGIAVCNTPTSAAQSVAEHAIGLILALAKQTLACDRAVREGQFDRKYGMHLSELHGKTLGIVGCGRVGVRTATIARAAFRMRLLGYSPSADPTRLRRFGIDRCEDLGALLECSDVVSLHVPLRAETRGLIGRAELARMKPGALLVNTARGAVVDEAALAEVLTEGGLGGAGLDVFASEPLPLHHPLLRLPNVVLSPHAAASSQEALERTAMAVAQVILRVASGRRPATLINPEGWATKPRHGRTSRRPGTHGGRAAASRDHVG
jgi:D-3-phosphoglycerate dehydrogenase